MLMLPQSYMVLFQHLFGYSECEGLNCFSLLTAWVWTRCAVQPKEGWRKESSGETKLLAASGKGVTVSVSVGKLPFLSGAMEGISYSECAWSHKQGGSLGIRGKASCL